MPAGCESEVYEPVFTVSEWYDGPRQGVASFRGSPHFYDCVFDVNDLCDYTDQYHLTPLSPSYLDAVLESWAIWQRWERAFHMGHAAEASHPALPADKARHDDLSRLLDPILQTKHERSFIQTGDFRAVDQVSSTPLGVLCDFEVRWSGQTPR